MKHKRLSKTTKEKISALVCYLLSALVAITISYVCVKIGVPEPEINYPEILEKEELVND